MKALLNFSILLVFFNTINFVFSSSFWSSKGWIKAILKILIIEKKIRLSFKKDLKLSLIYLVYLSLIGKGGISLGLIKKILIYLYIILVTPKPDNAIPVTNPL